MKQALHRRKRQPTNEQEMEEAIIEEWNALDQDWINGLIEQQAYWINVLVERRGWATPN